MNHATSSQGDLIDWDAALERHLPWLRKVIRCRVRDQHAVDDVVQNVALATLKQTSKPTEPDLVAPWLYRVAVRQVINFHRRSGRKSHAKPAADINPANSTAEPIDWLMAREQQSAMQQAISQLPPQDQQILTLKYTENWNYRQLAEKLGVKERTIEYRLMKARKTLRSLLTQTTHESNQSDLKNDDENEFN